ncbi:uncharacterized protein RAG0_02998 [Rhynchosporium agropyri]|uniref:Uncharacterized protein n=1 Tax=Rhynchosporium agropyri TaxID=914238 RepID=A0A1E1K3K3_9HELO|nr:uncharacterized protein RAG0_02998 [Rhynchosporium agropyri]
MIEIPILDSTELPSDSLFSNDVRKRLQSLQFPKRLGPIHPLLDKLDGITENEKNTLSPYYYRIENLAGGSNEVLSGLEAHYKLMQVRNTTSKGEVIDTIIRGSDHKTFKNIAKILDIIGSLAF